VIVASVIILGNHFSFSLSPTKSPFRAKLQVSAKADSLVCYLNVTLHSGDFSLPASWLEDATSFRPFSLSSSNSLCWEINTGFVVEALIIDSEVHVYRFVSVSLFL
jgi:hypothetical protein